MEEEHELEIIEVTEIDLSKYLLPDLTIDLQILAEDTYSVVKHLESQSEEDITLPVYGLEEYFAKRGVPADNEPQRREEKVFALSFITSIAMEASDRDTLVVKYV